MQTVLLICDDEERRAELHRLLLSDFEVYATDHASFAAMRDELGDRDVIVVEHEESQKGKISIYPVEREETQNLLQIIRSVVFRTR